MANVIAASPAARALALAKRRGIARARDFDAAGIPLVYLKRLCNEGRLVQLARGLYQLPQLAGTDAAHSLAVAARLMPRGVVCLLSALGHHGLTTQLPHAVWMTLPRKTRVARSAPFPIEVVHASEPALYAHVEHADIEGVRVPIYDVAKTVADCFKHRRRVGLDVAIEALRDAIRQRKATPAQVMRMAALDRVANVMHPYVETLT
ncbi:MAG: type IV toxin-antitoxin system AbiEi family antitoxin domain-containing protein [Alphaproteobacteria bacterium]|nr:type IV toxin-antitoxin system AbiEi family antitoxin domain-containing protein [Alphaproteobacteria bacterium]MCW5743943.1 type IV toxin-antitoxin system AbiEi family antitoxin domain-containing protein [Alphaproteobacteria bacterium]